MPRKTAIWIGADSNTPVPPRIRDRVLRQRYRGRCAECTRPITRTEQWICDHKVAIINGGPNDETNLQPLCEWCNGRKTPDDVSEKSRIYRIRKKNDAGLRGRPANPIPGSKASGWYKPMNGKAQRRQA